MGLAFLVPLFLAGLAAVAVPVYLHLRHRETDRAVRFPSLMFLERLPFRTAQRQRITDWPLLLLRAGALALLAAAFARPFFRAETAAATATRARAVVLLLDRSLSMSHRDVWPAALDSARAVVRQLAPGDRIAVVQFDDEAAVAQPLTDDRAAALAAINSTRPTSRGTRYAAALRAARQVLLGAPEAAGEIVAVTDLQRSGVQGLAGLELPGGLAVRAVAVGTAQRANTAVSAVDVQRRTEGTRTVLAVQARLINRELAAPRRARLTLALNGRQVGTRDVTLEGSGALSVAFDPVAPPAGRLLGVVTLEPDALPGDDTLRFTVPADDDLRLVLWTPADVTSDETLFLRRALAVGRNPVLRVERAPVGPGAVARARTAILWDAVPPAAPWLTQWVRDGGGLIVVAGRRFAARGGAGSIAPAVARGLADRLADRGGALGDVRLEHPLFAAFRDAPAALGAARFLRYPRLEPGAGADVLARFDDGLPAVIERREGLGRVIVVAAPLDAQAGDFPLQPAYLPLVRRLVLYAAGHEASPLWQPTGDYWLLPGGAADPVIATPDGALLRPRADTTRAAVALARAGLYALYAGRVAGEPLAVVAANPPPAESDLTPVDARELLIGVRQTDSAATAAVGPRTAAETERTQGWWRIALGVVAVVLLLETLLANRGWRAVERGAA